jgi:hypothetical protein
MENRSMLKSDPDPDVASDSTPDEAPDPDATSDPDSDAHTKGERQNFKALAQGENSYADAHSEGEFSE